MLTRIVMGPRARSPLAPFACKQIIAVHRSSSLKGTFLPSTQRRSCGLRAPISYWIGLKDLADALVNQHASGRRHAEPRAEVLAGRATYSVSLVLALTPQRSYSRAAESSCVSQGLVKFEIVRQVESANARTCPIYQHRNSNIRVPRRRRRRVHIARA